jgi:HipA-like protein
MRQGKVYNNNILAGIITELPNNVYQFIYDDAYFVNNDLPAIGIHFPKSIKVFEQQFLFPFFYSLISEGANKKIASMHLKIDEQDAFGFLLKTAAQETIGAIRVEALQ